jgi:hypothetical protein
VQRGQLIHESVFENIKKTKMTPKALLYDSLDWNDPEKFKNKKLVERDIYSNASTLMNELGKKNDVSEVDANTLLTLIASGRRMPISVIFRNTDRLNRSQIYLLYRWCCRNSTTSLGL